MLLDKSELDST